MVFAVARTHSMKSSMTGLNVRCGSVKIAMEDDFVRRHVGDVRRRGANGVHDAI
jgi:hypothetical protein